MKKAVIILILIAIAVIAVGFGFQPKSERAVAYHVTLADPKLYNNGIFTDNFKIQKGFYQFSFVASGDSPQLLSISLKGSASSYNQDFQLQGTSHNTGISIYYTWDYLGMKNVNFTQDENLQIVVDPHGSTLNSMSIYLEKI